MITYEFRGQNMNISSSSSNDDDDIRIMKIYTSSDDNKKIRQ